MIIKQLSFFKKPNPTDDYLLRDYSLHCQMLWEGYSMADVKNEYSSAEKLERFMEHHKLTIDELLAIYQYSISSKMLLGIARKECDHDDIRHDIISTLMKRIDNSVSVENNEMIKRQIMSIISSIDLSQPFMVLNDTISNAMVGIDLPSIYVKTAVEELLRLQYSDKVLNTLYKLLNKRILEPTVLYRGVKSNYLEKHCSIDTLQNKVLAVSSLTSTTYDYDAGFIRNDDTDLIFELHIGQGIHGLNIENISNYKCEKEILLYQHNVLINHVEKRFILNHKNVPIEKWYLICDVSPFQITDNTIVI